MISIPWESVIGHPFVDKEVYLSNFDERSPVIEEQEIQDWISFIRNETLWDAGVRSISDMAHADTETVLLAVSFICFFVFSKYVFDRHRSAFAFLFLLNPLLVDFGISQLRMALAASLLLAAFGSRLPLWKILSASAAILIHTASSIFIVVYIAAAWLERLVAGGRLEKRAAVVSLILFGLVIALSIGPARPLILGYIGDRRVEYESGSSSLLYGAFWIVFLAFQVMQPRHYFIDKANLYSIAIVSIFIFSIIVGIYGSRFIAAAFPIVISSMLSVRRQNRVVLFPLFIFYELLQWQYWMNNS